MVLLREKTSISQLREMASKMFGNLIKAVVDVHLRIMVIDAELHSDEECFMLENGSIQKDLWGINIYPDFDISDENFVEFDSMINLRPSDNNKTRSVEDPATRKVIVEIVREWVI